MSKKLTEYEINYIGVTPNEAQAIGSIIEQYAKLKERDTLPLNKYKSDIDKLNYDLIMFKDIRVALGHNADKRLIDQVEERIKTLEHVEKEFTNKIETHKANIKVLDDYVKSVNEHIVETIDKENMKVTYSYDSDFFKIWLGALSFLFEFDFGDEKQENEIDLNQS
jgi:Fe2+ transport system protein B